MNDFISNENSVEPSKIADGVNAAVEDEVLGSDDAEITLDNKKKIRLKSIK